MPSQAHRERAERAQESNAKGKPFQFPELVARINAVLRRRHGPAQGAAIEVGDLRIQPAAHVATRGGRPVELTARQFAVLELPAANAGRVLSKQEIFERVWGW